MISLSVAKIDGTVILNEEVDPASQIASLRARTQDLLGCAGCSLLTPDGKILDNDATFEMSGLSDGMVIQASICSDFIEAVGTKACIEYDDAGASVGARKEARGGYARAVFKGLSLNAITVWELELSNVGAFGLVASSENELDVSITQDRPAASFVFFNYAGTVYRADAGKQCIVDRTFDTNQSTAANYEGVIRFRFDPGNGVFEAWRCGKPLFNITVTKGTTWFPCALLSSSASKVIVKDWSATDMAAA